MCRNKLSTPSLWARASKKPLGIVPTAAYIIEQNIALHRLNVGPDSTFLY
jgi:hypothetical protein